MPPPDLPAVPSSANPTDPGVAVGAPTGSAWEDWFNRVLHGINPGGLFSGGPPAGSVTTTPSGDVAASPGAAAAGQTAPGPTSKAAPPVWAAIVQDIEVYGFLMLLVAIGLYGLFAPQINTVVRTAAATAAPELGAREIGKRIGHRLRPPKKERK